MAMYDLRPTAAREKAIIRSGCGYHEEYNGNLYGSFRRAAAPITVEVLELHYGGAYDAALVRLPNGHNAIADLRCFEA